MVLKHDLEYSTYMQIRRIMSILAGQPTALPGLREETMQFYLWIKCGFFKFWAATRKLENHHFHLKSNFCLFSKHHFIILITQCFEFLR